jgi:hypothetical protein
VARLSGTGRLADDLYLMAHNDISGKPHLQPRAIGLGLAGGLLAELMLVGKIRISPGGVAVADRAPPEDVLARCVLGLLYAPPKARRCADVLGLAGEKISTWLHCS